MKRCFAIILCLPVLCILLALSGCLGKQDQVPAPEIEYTEYEGQQCPKLKAAEEDGSVDIVNAEIEAQFRRLMGDGNDDSAVRTFRETPRLRRIQFSFILSQCCVLVFGLAGFWAAYQGSFPQK